MHCGMGHVWMRTASAAPLSLAAEKPTPTTTHYHQTCHKPSDTIMPIMMDHVDGPPRRGAMRYERDIKMQTSLFLLRYI